MILQIVRFKSAMTEQEIKDKYESRADRYRATNGLLQKYYLKFPETNEYGAVYVWESEDALKGFKASNLYKSIGDAYQVQGSPDVSIGEVVMTLRRELKAVVK